VIVARALQSVSLSKFCRHEIKQSLTTQRRTDLPTVLERLSSGSLAPDTVAAEFPCVVIEAHLAPLFPAVRVQDIAVMAAIDERCSLQLREQGPSMVSLDFHGPKSGFTAYIQNRCPAAALVMVVDRALPKGEDFVEAPATTVSHNPMSSCADVDACVASCAGKAPTVAFLDGSVDAAIEVAGLGNAHVERWRKRTLFAQLRATLRVLAADGVLIVKIGDTFTRFTASLLYVLAQVFFEFRIVKPFVSAPWTCDRYVVARGFRVSGVLASLHQHLADVHNQLDLVADAKTMPDCQQDVLNFVPIPRLLSPTFFRFLCRTTERFAQRETNAVAQLLTLPEHAATDMKTKTEAAQMALSQLSFLKGLGQHGATEAPSE
jgi:hypothetical protein